jgi:hypothetical protein
VHRMSVGLAGQRFGRKCTMPFAAQPNNHGGECWVTWTSKAGPDATPLVANPTRQPTSTGHGTNPSRAGWRETLLALNIADWPITAATRPQHEQLLHATFKLGSVWECDTGCRRRPIGGWPVDKRDHRHDHNQNSLERCRSSPDEHFSIRSACANHPGCSRRNACRSRRCCNDRSS